MNALESDALLVAIAYVMQRTPYVFPIIGGRKVEHLDANLEALNIALSKEHIAEIEGAVPFDLGWPANFIVRAMSCDPFCIGSKVHMN